MFKNLSCHEEHQYKFQGLYDQTKHHLLLTPILCYFWNSFQSHQFLQGHLLYHKCDVFAHQVIQQHGLNQGYHLANFLEEIQIVLLEFLMMSHIFFRVVTCVLNQ